MSETEANTSPSDDWKITTNRYVSYLDIMGFKDRVMRSGHEDIYNLMKKIDTSKKRVASTKWGQSDGSYVKVTTYSDSIMLYSKDETLNSLHSMLCSVSAITNDLFLENVPHKGAMAFGTMTLDTGNSIFFGQPLIDAYLLQEELAFYGIVVHGTAEEKIDELLHTKISFNLKYLCPFKNGSSNHQTIFPMFAVKLDGPKHEKDQERLFQRLDKLRYNTSGHLRKYIDNTEMYFNYVRENKIK